jgi:hypothetical protein
MKRKPFHGSLWRRLALFVAACLCMLRFAACERPMTFTVRSDSNPPTFELSGSGNLIFLGLFEVIPGKQSSVDDPVMWKIRPVGENRVDDLPEITYGVVPTGFQQTEPASGPPPLLLEGKIYELGGPTSNAPGGWIRFTIKDGKAVVIASGI